MNERLTHDGNVTQAKDISIPLLGTLGSSPSLRHSLPGSGVEISPTSMNESYSEYINSPAWAQKRSQRLAMSNYRCAACGTTKRLEVHHLTYARIFNEDMPDLLPLCYLHHLAAGEMVEKGAIPRSGDPTELARITLSLITPFRCHQPVDTPKKQKGRQPKKGKALVRNRAQETIMGEWWFPAALRLGRNSFKKEVHMRFAGHRYRGCMISNCFALYDRKDRILA